MKQIFSKIMSFLLALFVLFSTFSFTVAKHYCGDSLMDVSFTGESDFCTMNMDKVAIVKENCCKDEVHKVKGQSNLQTNKIDKITFDKQQFIAAFIISYRELLTVNESKNNFYYNFSPPNYQQDYQVLYQTFLI